jgi:hypothetical protein
VQWAPECYASTFALPANAGGMRRHWGHGKLFSRAQALLWQPAYSALRTPAASGISAAMVLPRDVAKYTQMMGGDGGAARRNLLPVSGGTDGLSARTALRSK